MAFVGISNRLIDDVRDGIRGMCSAELKTAGEVEHIRVTEHDHWFIDLAYGEHLHLRDVIPADWKKTYNGYGNIQILADGDTYSLDTRGEEVKGLPPNHRDYRAFVASVDNPRLPESVREQVTIIRTRRDMERRWNGVRDKVITFLESCKSLNEAIKLWPDIEHYVPKEYIERVLAKREKATTESRAAEILGSIDTQELTAAAVIARLSGATV